MSNTMRVTLIERLHRLQDYLFKKHGEMPTSVDEINQMQEERDAQIEACTNATVVDTLYGKYPDADFLTDLEAEHRQEISGHTTSSEAG